MLDGYSGTSPHREALHRDPVPCLVPSPDPATNTHVSGNTQESFSLVTTNLCSTKMPCFGFSQKGERLSVGYEQTGNKVSEYIKTKIHNL